MVEMRRISSRMTFFYKRVFPAIWFGLPLLFIAVLLIAGKSQDPIAFILMPMVMMVAGYYFMKKLLFDLVDEVLDAGDALIVRNGDREERIALSDITNVGYAQFMNPPRVTLSLRKPGLFGNRVSFCAPVRLLPLASSPIVDELIERIDARRRAR
jgi:hypothetical protein